MNVYASLPLLDLVHACAQLMQIFVSLAPSVMGTLDLGQSALKPAAVASGNHIKHLILNRPAMPGKLFYCHCPCDVCLYLPFVSFTAVPNSEE